MREPSPYLIERNVLPAERRVYEGELRPPEADRGLGTELQRYWKVIRKRITLVVSLPLIFMAITFLHDVITTPLYTATSTLLIKTKVPQLFETTKDSDEPDQGAK